MMDNVTEVFDTRLNKKERIPNAKFMQHLERGACSE